MFLRNGYNIAIGGSDSAEETDLVGLYLLNKLIEWILNIKGYLYRDDGLFLIRKSTNRLLENLKKKLHDFFKREGFKITIEEDNSQVNFLDANLNLINSKYKPLP